MSLDPRTFTVGDQWAADASINIPPTPPSGYSFRDPNLANSTIRLGQLYDIAADSATWNEILYRITGMEKEIELYGWPRWSPLTNYIGGYASKCTGMNGIPYLARLNSGPSSGVGAKDPVVEPDYWISLADWVAENLGLNNFVPDTRLIDTKLPLKGGGTLAKDLILSVLGATTSQEGVVRRATDEMVKAGVDEECYITPKQLLAALSSIGNGGDGSGGNGSGTGEDGDGSGGVIVTGPGARLFTSRVSGEWVVPEGVYSILITLTGGGAGGHIRYAASGTSGPYIAFHGGGGGSTCIGSREVTPGQVVPFIIGAAGKSCSYYIPAGYQFDEGGEPGGASICLGMTTRGEDEQGPGGGQINVMGFSGDSGTNTMCSGGGSFWGKGTPGTAILSGSTYTGIATCTTPGAGGSPLNRGQDGIILIQY